MFFDAIATFLNTIMDALRGVAAIGNRVSNPLGGIFNENSAGKETLPEETERESKEIPPQEQTGKRAKITLPEQINARFDSVGSPAWKNQPGGKHYGTDFGAPNGSAVFAPYAMTIVKVGRYDDDGRRGDYIIGTLADGTEYYTGHLSGVRVKAGDTVPAGTHIANIGYYNHTHIQLRVAGTLYDFEKYAKEHP